MFILNNILLISLAIASVSAAAAKCPTYRGVDHYDNKLFLGSWYQYASYDNNFTNGDCVSMMYSEACDGVKSNILVARLLNGTNVITEGKYSNSKQEPAQLYAKLDGKPLIPTNIYTNYFGFAFFYACSENKDGTISDDVWVLSRTPVPDAESQVKIDKFISTSPLINPDRLLCTKQKC